MFGTEDSRGNWAKVAEMTRRIVPIMSHFWKEYMLPLAIVAAGGWYGEAAAGGGGIAGCIGGNWASGGMNVPARQTLKMLLAPSRTMAVNREARPATQVS